MVKYNNLKFNISLKFRGLLYKIKKLKVKYYNLKFNIRQKFRGLMSIIIKLKRIIILNPRIQHSKTKIYKNKLHISVISLILLKLETNN